MQEVDGILWAILAGELRVYVQNYELSKSAEGIGKWKLGPSYNVDYEIEEEIIFELYAAKDMSSWWYYQILNCTNINELPLYLKKLLKQFLPRFLFEYPEYQNAECLKIKDCQDTAK